LSRRWGRPAALAACAFALIAPSLPAQAASSTATTLTLRLGSTTVIFGHALAVGGTISHDGSPQADQVVELQLDRYPYSGFAVIASTRSAANGSFAFAGIRPSRNSRVRVIEAGGAGGESPTEAVTVNPAVTLQSRALARGQTLLSATAVHTKSFSSPPVNAFWYVALTGSEHFQFVAETRTSEARPGVTTMSAVVDPPAHRFAFVVCFVPAWARAMGPPSARLPCRDHDFVALTPPKATA